MAATEKDAALEVAKQSIHALDTPQQQFQYIASKADAHKTDSITDDDYLCLSQQEASAMETKPHIIANYANKSHNRASHPICDSKEDDTHSEPPKKPSGTEDGRCLMQQVMKLSEKNSDSNHQSESTQDDDLKDWVVPIENTTMQQAMECIGNKQQKIDELQGQTRQLQTALRHLNEKHNQMTTQLDTVTEEKSALTAANDKLNKMYTMQRHQLEALQNAYRALKGTDDELQRRYAESSRQLKVHKQKNSMLQQQIQSQDHSKCHELIKQHYNKCKMFENKYKNLLKETNPTHLIQQNHEVVHKYNVLLAKYSEMTRKYNDYAQANKKGANDDHAAEEKKTNHDHVKCNTMIEELKKDLAHAQRSILEMTNVVGVKQKLPTVQETLSIFHSIRDQQHHNTSSELKKHIKLKHDDWNKYYINQCVHEFMFNVLCACYEAVRVFRGEIFDTMAGALNMRSTLKEVYGSEHREKQIRMKCEDEEMFIQNEIDRILSNRFGSYFKENYKTILNGTQIVHKVRRQVLGQKYAECVSDVDGNVLQSLDEYMMQCCDVCWIMILQDPMLHLTPMVWRGEACVMFDDSMHKRVLGSDRKCQQILYYVWPVIARNVDNILDDQKMDVVLKDGMYGPQKQNKT